MIQFSGVLTWGAIEQSLCTHWCQQGASGAHYLSQTACAWDSSHTPCKACSWFILRAWMQTSLGKACSHSAVPAVSVSGFIEHLIQFRYLSQRSCGCPIHGDILGWMGPWAIWFSGLRPCPWQGGRKLVIFKVPFISKHSVILWSLVLFCDCGWSTKLILNVYTLTTIIQNWQECTHSLFTQWF